MSQERTGAAALGAMARALRAALTPARGLAPAQALGPALASALALALSLGLPWSAAPALAETSEATLADSDGDGVEDGADCRPLDASVWSPPSEARNLTLSGGATTTLAWSAPSAPGGSIVVYDVLRSASPWDFSAAACIFENRTTRTTTDSAMPADLFCYLVRAKNACGENLGTNSSGLPRTGASCSLGGGELCGNDGQCASGYCTDGYCCESRCGGDCEACDLPGGEGACQAVPAGSDPHNDCPADPASTCARTGQCSGIRTCALYASGIQCAAPFCASDTSSGRQDTCDGAGSCTDGGTQDCLPYRCDAATGQCRTACTASGQCAPNHSCKLATGQCLSDDGQTCSANGECYNNACCSNTCRNLTNDVSNCGACGLACTNPHGTTACVAGACAPSCSGGWGSCDGNPANGCERSLTTVTDCGGCNVPCSYPNATASCATGSCAFVACNAGYDNCDSNTGNGCEVAHATYPNSCSVPEYVGTACGDEHCGAFCLTTGTWTTFASKTGTTAKWFRARATECSSTCSAATGHRLTLYVPSNIDYDLYVYSPCGIQLAQSQNGTGQTEQLTVSRSETGGDDSFDYWVEVRYYSGSSCGSWSLTFEGRCQ